MKVKVYRAEAPVTIANESKFYGPFVAGCYNKDYEKVCNQFRNELSGRIDEPCDDNPSKEWFRGMISGFTDFAMGQRWLPMRELWRKMAALGFVVGVYEIEYNDIGWCDSQIFWHPNQSTRVGEIDLIDLYDMEMSEDFIPLVRPTKKDVAIARWNDYAKGQQALELRRMIMEEISIPKPNQKCSCGSGLKFKKCCAPLFNKNVKSLGIFAQRNNLSCKGL